VKSAAYSGGLHLSKTHPTIIALIEKEVASIPKLVHESISESINATAAEAGNVTAPMVMARLEEVADHIKEVVRTEVGAAYSLLQQ
jgi:hypothetical protein